MRLKCNPCASLQRGKKSTARHSSVSSSSTSFASPSSFKPNTMSVTGRHQLHTACLLPLLSLLLLALSFPTPSLSAEVIKICPGVTDCAHSAVDIKEPERRQKGHVSGVTDLAACQRFCRDTRHPYYRFLSQPAPKKGLCACFDGCAALVPGNHTVGLVDACMASPLLRLRAQQQQELGDWDQAGENSAALKTESEKEQEMLLLLGGQGGETGAVYLKGQGQVNGQEKGMVGRGAEQQGVLRGGFVNMQGVEELQQLQQKKQLERQKEPGWQALQLQQVYLLQQQQKFLEQEQQALASMTKQEPKEAKVGKKVGESKADQAKTDAKLSQLKDGKKGEVKDEKKDVTVKDEKNVVAAKEDKKAVIVKEEKIVVAVKEDKKAVIVKDEKALNVKDEKKDLTLPIEGVPEGKAKQQPQVLLQGSKDSLMGRSMADIEKEWPGLIESGFLLE